MIRTALKSPKESIAHIATLFRALRDASTQDRFAHQPVFLSVREDICFGDGWLNLGEVALKPAPKGSDEEESNPSKNAVRCGFYEWKTRAFDLLQAECLTLMRVSKNGKVQPDDKAQDLVRRALHSIVDAAMRMGLLLPRLDADMVATMPFRRPTTVVTDTSAVIKGGVDFLIRFLCPMARLKIPAVVAMEILNQSDGFISKRRRSLKKAATLNQKPGVLLDHVVSQAGQRAMLRFELYSDIEIERTPIFSDPLRNAFQPLKDTDWQDLNLSTPVRSYCDRLILETARQHLSTVTPGHPVMLMTGDEGLARMALAEGMQPLFFHASRPPELYGQVLTGTRFHPFTGEFFSIPLQCLLWELAVTFGNARLANQDGSRFFEVRAIHQDLNWQPFHAKDDLLRVSWGGFDIEQEEKMVEQPSGIPTHVRSDASKTPAKLQRQQAAKEKAVTKRASRPAPKPRPKLGPFNPRTVYRFDLNVFLEFIPALLEKDTVPVTCKGTPLEEKDRRTLRKYLGFMTTGGFITEVENGIQSTEAMQQLWDALKSRDMESASRCFRTVPSLGAFLNTLQTKGKIAAAESERPSYTYVQIAELCGWALQIPQEAIYGTFSNPSASEFVDPAIQTYESLRKGEEYVLTGLWLEALARQHGIHPAKARDRLAEAQAGGMIERYTQGSTPDTRFEKHTLTVLQIRGSRPVAEKMCLYHGDFIIPGKASVSIRLERK